MLGRRVSKHMLDTNNIKQMLVNTEDQQMLVLLVANNC